MRETYKTVKGAASADFASMARQLVADLKVGTRESDLLISH